ncbi:hypothetical protein EYF80_011239 [Liparis tanakae]|uniref:Immunoglobulin subtype domain-containing protein n=1 Tax=Liparis tanakae TaxID=230148 RepID=A0A4Z2IKM7_9TELE|nr:hypothetical protein EYF80_011239 [Liparis tanakae]
MFRIQCPILRYLKTGLTEDMRETLLLLSLSLAVLLPANVLAQDPYQITFQEEDPVLVRTGAEIVFTVLTGPAVFSMTWGYQGGVTVGQWSGGSAAINTGTQFQGRVTITANQLRIGGAELRDAGEYTVTVIPTASTGLVANSRSIQLSVFVEVRELNSERLMRGLAAGEKGVRTR